MNTAFISGILITCIGILFLIAFVKEKIINYSVKAVILKTLVSCCFMAVAFLALFSSGISGNVSLFKIFILAGLFCGLMGDVWLELKLVYKKDETAFTYAGFIFFAVGHVFFISGVICSYALSDDLKYIIPAVIIAVAAGITTVLIGPKMGLDYGKYKTISMVYAPFLIGTALISLAVFIGNISVPGMTLIPAMMFIGGVSFLISDLVLSGTYFGKGKERPIDFILNYIFYYGAQFIIAWAAFAA